MRVESKRANFGIYCGVGRHGPVFAPPEHCAVVLGPPRSGKTTSIVVPNVLAANGTAVCISTKRDVLDTTAPMRRLLGPCYLFDPTGRTAAPQGVEPMTWSPLDTAGDWDRAVLGAESMVGSTRASSSRDDSSHWGERAGALLSAVFHAAALECASMGDVVASVNRREPGRWLSVLASQQNLLPLDVLTGIVETDEREQSGIWSTASSVLRAYRTGGALANSCGSPIDFSSLWRERSTLYVVAGSENQHHLAPLIAGLVRDLRSAVYDATGRGVYTPDPRPPVLLVLDELANSAPLHDLPALVADGASQGVVTLACLQDLSQARSRWGVAADGFFSLFGAKIVLGGLGDTRTLESLSLLAGEREVPTVSVTTAGRGRGRARSQRSLSTRRQRLLPPDAVAAAAPGRAICVFGASLGRVSLVPYVDSAPERPFGDRRAPRGLHR